MNKEQFKSYAQYCLEYGAADYTFDPEEMEVFMETANDSFGEVMVFQYALGWSSHLMFYEYRSFLVESGGDRQKYKFNTLRFPDQPMNAVWKWESQVGRLFFDEANLDLLI